MAEYIQESLQTPIRGAFDVVVCGGGTAGFTAALSAARNGAKTLLIEHNGYIGGTLINGAGPLHSFYNLFHMYPEAGKHQVVKGIAQEIVDRLVERKQSPGHMEMKRGGGYDSVITIIDREGYKSLAIEMLQEAGVTLLLHTDVVSVMKDGDRVTGVIIQSKSGREAICSKVVIDTTGDADVAFLAGCGTEKRHHTTSVGMPFGMQNVDMKRLVAYLEEKGLITQYVAAADTDPGNPAIRLGFDLKRVPEFTEFMAAHGIWGPLGYSLHENEYTYINGANVRDVDATDVARLTEVEVELRMQVAKLSSMLIRYIPGFEHAYVNWTPSKIGVRLTRIVECEHILDLDEITDAKHFPDEIFQYGFHDSAPRVTIRDGQWYGFPYSALVPKKIDGLLVAGRCVTREWEAHMSTRNTVSCMAQGQAVGTAAALSVQTDTLPRNVDIARLQQTLKNQGVVLD